MDTSTISLQLGSLAERKARLKAIVTTDGLIYGDDADNQTVKTFDYLNIQQQEQKQQFNKWYNNNHKVPKGNKRQRLMPSVDELKTEFRQIKSECVAKLLLDLWRVPYYDIHYEVHMEWNIRMRPLMAKGLDKDLIVDEMLRMVSS